MSTDTARPARSNAIGWLSTFTSSGTPSSKGTAGSPPAWYRLRAVVSTWTFPSTGEAASSPMNSPICHCFETIQSASRTSARMARPNSSARGRPSSRFQSVIVGR